MTATKTRNRTALIQTLREAADQKGDTPTAQEADERAYGLAPKRTYMQEFGSWNASVRAAGLRERPWKGRRGRRNSPDRRGRGPIMGGHETMLSFIDSKIHEERAALEVLEQARKVLERL